ncbi:MAG TPA: flagellar hook assembly protein FlgD [Syntrophales bacterium]|nr:flagellar hook assembly protein FlgD [Syntrophales bacterium]HOX93439.1 flagellar hook assembly protein FlgD [Syntrophales bacterium]HPI56658.1 flagellar hook assembly protein FlgD [Syntrophales bacterium]HPN24916.1 flagellar hook assembly protein FlgD [Syntrophales bacterium]HQM29725.1 flagellar hook assembly protein FlgD [Syntrophales bacterium]
MAGLWIEDTTTVTSAASSKNSMSTDRVMGKEEFLKMLIAQLKNQNPLNPLDGTEFTAQLAQFSSLEQLQNVYTELKALSQRQASLNNSHLVSLIGQEVTLRGNAFTASGEPVGLTYDLGGDAARVWVRIYDQQGGLVDTVTAQNQGCGTNAVTWSNTRNLTGNFTFDVTAIDRAGDAVSVSGVTRGIVTGVNFREDTPCLMVDGREVSITDVLSVVRPARG